VVFLAIASAWRVAFDHRVGAAVTDTAARIVPLTATAARLPKIGIHLAGKIVIHYHPFEIPMLSLL
jgi:hypothetical protein